MCEVIAHVKSELDELKSGGRGKRGKPSSSTSSTLCIYLIVPFLGGRAAGGRKSSWARVWGRVVRR